MPAKLQCNALGRFAYPVAMVAYQVCCKRWCLKSPHTSRFTPPGWPEHWICIRNTCTAPIQNYTPTFHFLWITKCECMVWVGSTRSCKVPPIIWLLHTSRHHLSDNWKQTLHKHYALYHNASWGNFLLATSRAFPTVHISSYTHSTVHPGLVLIALGDSPFDDSATLRMLDRCTNVRIQLLRVQKETQDGDNSTQTLWHMIINMYLVPLITHSVKH